MESVVAEFDIMSLDPLAPTPVAPAPVTVPKPAVRKPAATARPVAAPAPSTTSTDTSSSSSKSSSPSSGSVAYTPSGVAYSVPFATPPSSHFNRARWTESQLHLRSNEFTETKELSVFVGSWNINGKKVRDERDLAPWLLHRVRTKGQRKAGSVSPDDDDDSGGEDEASGSERQFKAPDVYVIGFQEIVDLNASNLLVTHSAAEPWEEFIHDTLARTGKAYVKVTSVTLVGLSMCIFVKEKHIHAVSDVRVDEVGCGIMGVGGNKGAVLVKLRIYKTVFCFINSHLAAHQGAVKARNADFWSIVRRASFEGPRKARVRDAAGFWHDPEEHRRRTQPSSNADNFAASASSFFDSVLSKSRVIMDNVQSKKAANSLAAAAAQGSGSGDDASDESGGVHSVEDLEAIRKNPHGIFHGTSHVVWLGDNNYRLNVVELGMSATHALIASDDYPRLLQYDQLLQEKRARNTFVGFVEPRIEFRPTYKFITGTSEYDNRADKKVRYPAYTDRIQYMTCKPPARPASLAALTNPPELVINSLYPLYYTSTWKLTASDHKPVMMLLEAPIVFEREKSKRKIVSDLAQLADAECTPRIQLSTTRVDFGTVCFDYAVTRSIVVRNVGDAVVAFRIAQRTSAHGGQDAAAASKPWLRILPASGLLARGQTQTIHVTMHVTSRNGAAQLLNAESESLSCDLLLRLDAGLVYKVRLDADYEKSVCGSDLSYLNSLPCKNIRKASPEDVVNNDESFSVPQFLFKLLDYMTEKKAVIKAKQNAFVAPEYVARDDDDEEEAQAAARAKKGRGAAPPANPLPQQVCTHAMRWIIDYLDTGRSLDKEPREGKWRCPAAPPPTEPPGELPAAAFFHTLLYWLSSLPSPLLVASSSHRWITGTDLTAWCYQTMLETEVEKYRTLVYVLTFAREIVAQHRQNGCHVATFASLLGVALCHKPASGALSPIMPITPATIVQHILTSADFAHLPQDNSEHQQALQASHITALPPEHARRAAASQPRGRYPDIE